jgi:predicted Ser/Thr protein kinase
MIPEAERHRLLRAVFDEALLLDAAERDAYLDRACSGDPALRAQAARLLAVHHAADSFLEHPARLPSADQDAAEFTGSDRFRVVRTLGRGGMGVVYEAHDARRDAAVALKTLRRAGAVDLYRLKREFRSLADVAHPNIVCLYELFVEGDRPFFTMELIEGVNFVDWVRGPDRTRLDIDRLRDALRQLVDGVATLHRKGLLHRDVKPSNVLVTPTGRVVILDFGLIADSASRRARDTVDGGTPAYMSPEEAAATEPSEAGDWYGVGATIYEALTGQLPFSGSVAEVLRQKQLVDPVAPIDLAAGVPSDLSALCMGLLHRDPKLRLTADGLLRKLNRDGSPEAPTRSDTPFVGRDDQLRTLEKADSAVERGEARTVVIYGPSGIGKSTLVRKFIARTEQSRATMVLAGRCYENESVPYKGLDGVVDELSRHLSAMTDAEVDGLLPDHTAALARVFPVLRRVGAIARASGAADDAVELDPFQVRRRALEAFRSLLTGLAARQQLVIWIDDLQWADADSMQLLDELLAPPGAPAMLTLLSFRGEEVSAKPFLRAMLERKGQADRDAVSLEPLTDDEARQLIEGLLPADSPLGDDERQRLTSEAGGSPFVLEQIALYSGGRSSRVGAAATLAGMFDARLDALSPHARLFLETLAICGRPMAADVICDASGVGRDRHSLVVMLRSSHLIRSSGSSDRVETYHDRIREALAARVAMSAARGIHGRIAASLIDRRSDDCEALFEHHRGAGDLEQAAVQAGLAADKAAAALAFDRAASFYQHALDLAPASSDTAATKRQLAMALANAGRPADAAGAYLRAAENASRQEQVALQRAAAEQFLVGGHIDQGLEQLGQVLNRVGLSVASSPRGAAVRLLWRRARLRWRGLGFDPRSASEVSPDQLLRLDACWAAAAGLALVDIVSASGFITQHLILALDAGEPSRIARGMAIEASARAADWAFRGSAGRFAECAAALSKQVGTPQAEAIELLADSITACAIGQWRRAHVSSERSLAILRERCVGVTWEMTIAQNMFIWSLMYMGDLGEVSRRVPVLMNDAQRRGNLYLATEFATRANFVWLAADDPDGGERVANEAIARWSQQGFHRQHFSAMLARVQTALYRGDGRAAWRLLGEHESKLRASMLMQVQALRVEYTYLRGRSALAMAMAEPADRRWLSIARAAARRIARERMHWSDGIGLLLEAGITSVAGRCQDAAAALTSAIAQFDRAEMKLYAAVARRRIGDLGIGDYTAMRQQADAWMADQPVKNPECFTRMFAPGFPSRRPAA